jgi:hypothetical protein
MTQHEIDITEFLIQNKELVLSHLNSELIPFEIASRIFKSHPDIELKYINSKKLSILRHYLLEHFSHLNFEDISLLCDEEMLKLLT